MKGNKVGDGEARELKLENKVGGFTSGDSDEG